MVLDPLVDLDVGVVIAAKEGCHKAENVAEVDVLQGIMGNPRVEVPLAGLFTAFGRVEEVAVAERVAVAGPELVVESVELVVSGVEVAENTVAYSKVDEVDGAHGDGAGLQ